MQGFYVYRHKSSVIYFAIAFDLHYLCAGILKVDRVLKLENARRIIILLVVIWGCVIFVDAQRRPVIGISDLHKDGTNAAVPRSYVDAVLSGGGIPVVVPLMHDEEKIIELLNSLDGIVFTGGEDFDPKYYNERPIPQMGKINASRDEFDIRLLHLAAERSIPILGICRGIQLINIAYGGTLYQDLGAQYHDNSIRHRQKQAKDEVSHSVLVEDNTVFADIVKERMLMVNSSHHQAIKDVARGFRVAGKSPDRIVEVIEKIDDDNWILGVQFHPEVRVTKDHTMRRIFQRFIFEAGRLENPNRNVKIASVPRPEIVREPAPVPQVVYNSVIDTQFIYKFVRDTVYSSVDTVFMFIPEYISIVDTQYISVTEYVSVPDTQFIYITDTIYLSAPDTLKNASEVSIPTTSTNSKSSTPKVVKAEPDTLIFTPGSSSVTPDTLKSKKEKKEQARKAKKEAEQKEVQSRDEQMERARQNKKEQKEKDAREKDALRKKEELKKKEQKEQKEKEALAKKEAKAKEKEFKKMQKENAKLDKKELKEQEKRDRELQKEKQKQGVVANKKQEPETTLPQEQVQKQMRL